MESLYDREAVRPMWEELANVGIKPLKTPEEVDAEIGAPEGATLLIINSVCGCAAGSARPGVALALQHHVIPDRSVTVFAGVDRAAVERARGFMPGVAPSSPFIALFKDGRLIHALERRHIEQMSPVDIAANLSRAFDEYCSRPGPSVSREAYERAVRPPQCGSTIPLYRQG